MVGVADPKNPKMYPELNEPSIHFPSVIGGNYKIWNAVVIPGNQICWTLGQQLSLDEAKDLQFRNSEWGPESNETMIREFQDYLCPLGGKMSDIIDDTPKDRISRVFLEEKVFRTWYHGRTVLIGDAAHKLQPVGGFGAVNAFQDTVILANCLYEMQDTSSKSVTSAFEKYYSQHHRHVQAQFDLSHTLSKVLMGQTLIERVMRQVLFKYVPSSLFRRETIKNWKYCSTVAWLPPVKKNRSTTTSKK
ncbi:hypothetical protein BGX27_001412 [Mortierella sp. AM989]|nr:hypothetical protein BGX27_001412 [Mortierella sp. AM989]